MRRRVIGGDRYVHVNEAIENSPRRSAKRCAQHHGVIALIANFHFDIHDTARMAYPER